MEDYGTNNSYPDKENESVTIREDASIDSTKPVDTDTSDRELSPEAEAYFNKRFEDAFNTSQNDPGSSVTVPYSYDYQSNADNSKKPKKKRSSGSHRVLIVLLCALLSLGCGFGGAAIAQGVFSNNGGNSKTISATNYDLAKATGSELSIQEIIAQNENSVVEISTESVTTDNWMQQYVTEGAGSGIIIQKDGYIVTNNHVIDGARKINVTLHDGKEYKAELVATDPVTDVAVIKIDTSKLSPVTYGDSSELNVGDLAVAIGNPLGELGGTATSGIISSLDRELSIDGQNMTLLQTDAAINPGNSGGGLFNQYGQLIGMVVAKSSGSDVEGLGFAIPINTVAEIASKLIDGGEISGRAAAGITIQDVDAQTAMENGLRYSGVYITKVNGTNAKNAGLQPGDYVYYIDDQKIENSKTLKSIISSHKVGDKVTFIVVRDDKTVEISFKLEDSTETD